MPGDDARDSAGQWLLMLMALCSRVGGDRGRMGHTGARAAGRMQHGSGEAERQL